MNVKALQPDQSGLSLVEILVTTVVFSVGLLGVTGLNAVSQRASYEAVQRSLLACAQGQLLGVGCDIAAQTLRDVGKRSPRICQKGDRESD